MPKHKALRHEDKASVSREGSTTISLDHEEIARLAYLLWLRRGCPIGSPEKDWSRAVHELTREQTFKA